MSSVVGDFEALKVSLKLFEQPQSKSECCAEMKRNFAMEKHKNS